MIEPIRRHAEAEQQEFSSVYSILDKLNGMSFVDAKKGITGSLSAAGTESIFKPGSSAELWLFATCAVGALDKLYCAIWYGGGSLSVFFTSSADIVFSGGYFAVRNTAGSAAKISWSAYRLV